MGIIEIDGKLSSEGVTSVQSVDVQSALYNLRYATELNRLKAEGNLTPASVRTLIGGLVTNEVINSIIAGVEENSIAKKLIKIFAPTEGDNKAKAEGMLNNLTEYTTQKNSEITNKNNETNDQINTLRNQTEEAKNNAKIGSRKAGSFLRSIGLALGIGAMTIVLPILIGIGFAAGAAVLGTVATSTVITAAQILGLVGVGALGGLGIRSIVRRNREIRQDQNLVNGLESENNTTIQELEAGLEKQIIKVNEAEFVNLRGAFNGIFESYVTEGEKLVNPGNTEENGDKPEIIVENGGNPGNTEEIIVNNKEENVEGNIENTREIVVNEEEQEKQKNVGDGDKDKVYIAEFDKFFGFDNQEDKANNEEKNEEENEEDANIDDGYGDDEVEVSKNESGGGMTVAFGKLINGQNNEKNTGDNANNNFSRQKEILNNIYLTNTKQNVNQDNEKQETLNSLVKNRVIDEEQAENLLKILTKDNIAEEEKEKKLEALFPEEANVKNDENNKNNDEDNKEVNEEDANSDKKDKDNKEKDNLIEKYARLVKKGVMRKEDAISIIREDFPDKEKEFEQLLNNEYDKQKNVAEIKQKTKELWKKGSNEAKNEPKDVNVNDENNKKTEQNVEEEVNVKNKEDKNKTENNKNKDELGDGYGDEDTLNKEEVIKRCNELIEAGIMTEEEKEKKLEALFPEEANVKNDENNKNNDKENNANKDFGGQKEILNNIYLKNTKQNVEEEANNDKVDGKNVASLTNVLNEVKKQKVDQDNIAGKEVEETPVVNNEDVDNQPKNKSFEGQNNKLAQQLKNKKQKLVTTNNEDKNVEEQTEVNLPKNVTLDNVIKVYNKRIKYELSTFGRWLYTRVALDKDADRVKDYNEAIEKGDNKKAKEVLRDLLIILREIEDKFRIRVQVGAKDSKNVTVLLNKDAAGEYVWDKNKSVEYAKTLGIKLDPEKKFKIFERYTALSKNYGLAEDKKKKRQINKDIKNAKQKIIEFGKEDDFYKIMVEACEEVDVLITNQNEKASDEISEGKHVKNLVEELKINIQEENEGKNKNLDDKKYPLAIIENVNYLKTLKQISEHVGEAGDQE